MSTIWQELKRIATEPSKYQNSKIFFVCVVMVLVGFLGFVANLVTLHPFNCFVYLALFLGYGLLGFKYWPWR